MPPSPSAGAVGDPADSETANWPNEPVSVVVTLVDPKSPPGPDLNPIAILRL